MAVRMTARVGEALFPALWETVHKIAQPRPVLHRAHIHMHATVSTFRCINNAEAFARQTMDLSAMHSPATTSLAQMSRDVEQRQRLGGDRCSCIRRLPPSIERLDEYQPR